MGATVDDVVSQESLVEGNANQLWKKGKPDAEGYFTLENSGEQRVLTAISESDMEIKGNITTYEMNIYEYLIIYRVIILHIDAYGYEFDFVDYDFQKISEIEENHIDLLQHPVNESFMIQKWSEIRQRLKKNCFVYFGFVLCLTVMVQSNYWQLPNSKKFLIYSLQYWINEKLKNQTS